LGKTISEKIFQKHCGRECKAGDFVVADLDFLMAHDSSRPQALEIFRRLKGVKVFDNRKMAYFIVGGSNFGTGSSREAAPLVIQAAGIGAVLAKSFARIFFRNGINVGLPLLECNTDLIDDGDVLSVDLGKNLVTSQTGGKKIDINPLPRFLADMLEAGGLENYFKKNKSFNL
jgi:3-isopropylmalate dehydratase small subunit